MFTAVVWVQATTVSHGIIARVGLPAATLNPVPFLNTTREPECFSYLFSVTCPASIKKTNQPTKQNKTALQNPVVQTTTKTTKTNTVLLVVILPLGLLSAGRFPLDCWG